MPHASGATHAHSSVCARLSGRGSAREAPLVVLRALFRMLVPTAARLLGLAIGARVDVQLAPAKNALFAPLGFGTLSNIELTATTNSDARWSPLPMDSASLYGSDVALGWKAPALLLAPLWMLTLRPPTLLLLLIAWLRVPNWNGRGNLQYEFYANSRQLNRGLWRWLLGLVLDGIGRTSLPGVLATLNADGTSSPYRLPRSTCEGVAVGNRRLVLDGRLPAFEMGREPMPPSGRRTGNQPDVVTELGPLDYTLRMGLRPGTVESDGTVLNALGGAPPGRACLIWDTPELKVSLGDSALARLIPPLWVPVVSVRGGSNCAPVFARVGGCAADSALLRLVRALAGGVMLRAPAAKCRPRECGRDGRGRWRERRRRLCSSRCGGCAAALFARGAIRWGAKERTSDAHSGFRYQTRAARAVGVVFVESSRPRSTLVRWERRRGLACSRVHDH